VRDNRKEKISEYFSKTNEFIEKVLESKENVLVHCAKGISRSATIVLAFMMYKFKMSTQDAMGFVKRKRN
jgi:protein-tyrosine phosphatase